MYRNEHSIASGMNDECHNVKSNKRPQRFLASLANKNGFMASWYFVWLLTFLTCYAVNTRWQKININGCSQWFHWLVCISLGIILVLLGRKPLPEPIMLKTHDVI